MAPSYKRVSTESDDSLPQDTPKTSRHELLYRIIWVAVPVLFTSVFWWIFFTQHYFEKLDAKPLTKLLHCGNSTAEAKALGCQFDPLTVNWVPVPCMDMEVISEYEVAMAHGEAYSDKTKSQALSFDQMSEAAEYWTSLDEHLTHCAYMLRIMHRRYLTGNQLMDDGGTDYVHTLHCTGKFIDWGRDDPKFLADISTENHPGFTKCLVTL